MIKAALAFIAVTIGTASYAQTNLSRAELNLRRLLTGERQFAQLSPAERNEVMELERILRLLPTETESSPERCWRTQLEHNPSPSELALELMKLRCGTTEQPREQGQP